MTKDIRTSKRYKRSVDEVLAEEALTRLHAFTQDSTKYVKTFITYPVNFAFNLREFFNWWVNSVEARVMFNDVGNWEEDVYCHLNAHAFEREVIHYFEHLYKFKPNSAWGYVTGSGTQGNEQGLFMGREILRKFGKPILYVSDNAHYSILNVGKILDLECCTIKTDPSGEMDYEDLKEKLNSDRPALFSVCLGTTFKGAIDDIEEIKRVVDAAYVKHVYYHVDAALFGGFLPFLQDPKAPEINFEKYPFDSIAVSGHKFFGSPVPLGVFLIRRELMESMEQEYIQYLNSHNMTIACSRSSLNTLIFWWTLTTVHFDTFQEEAIKILENAIYLYNALKAVNYPVYLNPYSNTVFFKEPIQAVKEKWSLASVNCPHYGRLSHVVVMQHGIKEHLDEFVHDIS
ncbi:MAG: histidine decarboxylase [Chlamydiales bacterium]|nr:histidine decarboxylase [Chlamydiales bacterium]